METRNGAFSLAEKLAIVYTIESVIMADGHVHDKEIGIVGELMKLIDFDSNFILQARNTTYEQCLTILQTMTNAKKLVLAGILEEVAKSDGFVHHREISLMRDIFSSIGVGRMMVKRGFQ